MFGVLRSVALFLVFVSSTSTRVDRLSEKYTVNIFAEIQWEPFSAPIFTVNPMIDDVISIPLFWFFIFSNSLCVWWMSCFLEVESVLLFGGRLDITTRSALYLSLCDAFTLKESQRRRWWLFGNDLIHCWFGGLNLEGLPSLSISDDLLFDLDLIEIKCFCLGFYELDVLYWNKN